MSFGTGDGKMRSKAGLDGRLRLAVRAGDAEAVRDLLDRGADPDTAHANGLPVLCVAVAAYDDAVAEALVEGGADPDRVLPDGTTPLSRAIDGGSPAVFSAVLGKEPRLRLAEPARERLLALARSWYEAGAAEELRRRTGTPVPVATARVKDGEYDLVDQVSVGDLVARAGHGAILTSLEWAFRVLTPVDELIARAVEHRDEEHVDWSAVCWILTQRRSFETWSAVVACRHDPDRMHRELVLDYLWRREISDIGSSYEKEESEFLAAWAARRRTARCWRRCSTSSPGMTIRTRRPPSFATRATATRVYAAKCPTPSGATTVPDRLRPGRPCSLS